MSKKRVVITGLGIVSPVGNTVNDAWNNILAGKSGITNITAIDTTDQAVKFGGTIKGFDVSDYISPKDAKKMDIFIHYGMAAGIQAVEDSGIEANEENADRIGVAIGAGVGGLGTIEATADLYRE
ncbi:MAG: beta-ketoacyl synthase N-terminal-like domain-containing protein, partial [Gammaproteobacteria bacterium]